MVETRPGSTSHQLASCLQQAHTILLSCTEWFTKADTDIMPVRHAHGPHASTAHVC
jgi:hypothetical protein